MKRLAAYAIGVAALIGLDQAAKAVVEARLPFEQVVPVMPFLSLFRTWNKGISFSLLAAFGDRLLIAIAIAVTIFVLVLAWRTSPAQRFARVGYAFIVAGALGNLVDRIAYGHVVDFILFHTQSWTFAVFNLADAFISVGATLVVLQEVMAVLDDRRKAAKN